MNIRIDSVTLLSYKFAIISKIACAPGPCCCRDRNHHQHPSGKNLRALSHPVAPAKARRGAGSVPVPAASLVFAPPRHGPGTAAMTFVAKYTLEQWDEARRLRAEGLAFRVIAERVGFVRDSTVARRAAKEGWSSPAAAASVIAAGARVGHPPLPPSPATASSRRSLATRLYGVFELEIRMKELSMKKRLQSYRQASPGAEPPVVTEEERASFASLIQQINQVTEMASEPAPAADGRRKSASINPELTALSDDIDAGALDAASEKDNLRREIADKLDKMLPPSTGS